MTARVANCGCSAGHAFPLISLRNRKFLLYYSGRMWTVNLAWVGFCGVVHVFSGYQVVPILLMEGQTSTASVPISDSRTLSAQPLVYGGARLL